MRSKQLAKLDKTRSYLFLSLSLSITSLTRLRLSNLLSAIVVTPMQQMATIGGKKEVNVFNTVGVGATVSINLIGFNDCKTVKNVIYRPGGLVYAH